MKDDKEVVLTAIKQNSKALGYASVKVVNDKDIALRAIKKSVGNFLYVSDELKGDIDVVFSVVKRDSLLLMEASKEMQHYFIKNGVIAIEKEFFVNKSGTGSKPKR